MPSSRRVVATLAAGAALAAAAAGFAGSGSADPADAPLVTPLTSAALGHRRALEFLATPERKELAAAAGKAAASVVRIQCRYGAGAAELCDRGTGFVVDGARVVVPSHALAHIESGRLSVQLTDGSELPASCAQRGACKTWGDCEDWAVLRVEVQADRLPPPLELGVPREGSEVVLIGFGGDAGIGPEERVVANRDGMRLAPTWCTGRVVDAAALRLEPLAGLLPQGGASGSPVVDESGRVVALQVASFTMKDEDTTTTDDGRRIVTPPRFRYRVDCASVAGVAKLIAEPAPKPR